MPAARKSNSPARRPRSFKEPAALKRLGKSLDAAHEALMELRKDTGQGAHEVYTDVRTFVSSARRDTSKLAKALARDFEQAERRLAQTASGKARTTTTASRSGKARTASRSGTSSGARTASRSGTSSGARTASNAGTSSARRTTSTRRSATSK